VQTLNLILRADVRRSIEAILQELGKLEHPRSKSRCSRPPSVESPRPTCILADASDGIICGFNVVPDERARELAEQRGVQSRTT